MPHSPSELATLSRLLDEVLDLEPAEAMEWLSSLSEEHRHLRPKLEEMLRSHLSQSASDFMAGGPRLSGAVDETVARPGELVGPYRLIREIGRGGMGAVWLAERADGTLKRRIALKLPRLAWGAGLAERMARERDIGALLEHPNIARLYDAGIDARGRPYLALEYIEGVPLDSWCKTQAPPIAECLRLFLQITRAVAYAHGRLVVHRDIKPSNILVTVDGQVHLLDFGIAKLLHEARAVGDPLTQDQGCVMTPRYASPEQLRGDTITVASDVYALGVVLYELLSGRHPYLPERKSAAELELAIIAGEPSPMSGRTEDRGVARALRGELDAIVGQTLRHDPQARYATADALGQDIERHLMGERVLAQPDSVGYRIGKALRKHRTAFVAGTAILIAVLGGAGVSLVQAMRANDAAERARVVKEFVVDVFRVNERGTAGRAELRELPAELLLERGARLIQVRFPGQPALQAELFGVVGGIFADMGANELAVDYATRQLEALFAIEASAQEQARPMMLLGQALLAQDKLGDALVRARRALELAGSDRALRRKALVLLASVLFAQRQDDETSRVLDRLELEVKDHPRATEEGARTKALRAALLSARNRFEEGLPMYQSAIEEALAAEGQMSSAAVEIRLATSKALVSRGRTEESAPYREAALVVLRSTGGAGEIRAALEESSAAKNLFAVGQALLAQTQAAIERDLTVVEARGPLVPDSIRAKIKLDLGTVLAMWGDVTAADPLISGSAGVLRSRVESLSERRMLAAYQGMEAMYVGRHEQADVFLRERLEVRRLEGDGLHPFAAFDYAFVALNLCMQQRCEEARRFLEEAPSFGSLNGSGKIANIYSEVISSALARVTFELGDASAALGFLPTQDDGDDLLHMDFDNRLLRGEILCALGRQAEGLTLLQKSIAPREGVVYEHMPGLARARAVAGLCAFAAGQRKRAAELAQQAHAAFLVQPGVSPFFKQPSQTLDRLIAGSAGAR